MIGDTQSLTMKNASDILYEHKRRFFIFCTLIMIVTMVLLSVIDLSERDMREFTADLLVVTVLAANLLAILISRRYMLIFRLTHFLISLNFFYAIYIGAGEETVLFWAFFMPPLFFFFFSKWEGAVWALFFLICTGVLMLAPALFDAHTYNNTAVSRFLISFPIVTIICFGLESSRYLFAQMLNDKNQQLLREKKQLEQALTEIRTLNGLIPICANCKKIRNDEGFWEQVETYISNRSEADFSHSICPECAKRLYPDVDFKK